MQLINQIVGDAMADLVLVEAILADEQMTPAEWDSQYSNLPNQLSKVFVSSFCTISRVFCVQAIVLDITMLVPRLPPS